MDKMSFVLDEKGKSVLNKNVAQDKKDLVHGKAIIQHPFKVNIFWRNFIFRSFSEANLEFIASTHT